MHACIHAWEAIHFTFIRIAIASLFIELPQLIPEYTYRRLIQFQDSYKENFLKFIHCHFYIDGMRHNVGLHVFDWISFAFSIGRYIFVQASTPTVSGTFVRSNMRNRTEYMLDGISKYIHDVDRCIRFRIISVIHITNPALMHTVVLRNMVSE